MIQIVPALPPSTNGLGDYALEVAGAMRSEFGLDTGFVVGNPEWQGPGGSGRIQGAEGGGKIRQGPRRDAAGGGTGRGTASAAATLRLRVFRARVSVVAAAGTASLAGTAERCTAGDDVS